MTIKAFQNSAIVAFTALIFLSSFFQSNASLWPHAMSAAGALIFFLFFSKDEQLGYFWPLLVLTLVLLIYTVSTSILPIRSVVSVLTFAGSCLIYTSLKTHSNHFYNRDRATEGVQTDIIDMTILGLLVVTVIHSVSLISQYIEFPNRVTGLLKDYSQASMIILITFGLVYSRIRDSKYATPLCFVLFLGFFTTFSRTANVLLIVFLCALSLKEYNQGTFRRFAELTLIIGFAALIVYTFPMLAELEVVDRGGLAHIKTLNSRTTYWFAAWQAIQQVPFSGHGLNTFELTGIKVFLPQEEISMIHNDYLQILHDLGIVWFTLFVAALGYLIVKTAPCRNIWNPVALLRAAADTSLDKFVCWILLILIAAYMTINFLILSSLFQLSIVLILVKLMSTESDKLDA